MAWLELAEVEVNVSELTASPEATPITSKSIGTAFHF